MSWIHLDDHVHLIDFALKIQSLEGPLNATAPNPVRNIDFTRQLGQILKRPTPFPLPAFLLRFALGEMADALLLEGQRVVPRKATDAGFRFRYPELSEALSDLLVRVES
jgi:NAD dependent epimerase/dehydratase family enzyme